MASILCVCEHFKQCSELLNAKRLLNLWQLVGDWSATIPVMEKQLQWLQRSQSKSVVERSGHGHKLCGTRALVASIMCVDEHYSQCP